MYTHLQYLVAIGFLEGVYLLRATHYYLFSLQFISNLVDFKENAQVKF